MDENRNGSGEVGFRLTIGLRRVDGQWVIAREHHSVAAA
jgi:hypothetical protein